jgi:hypothetical protein
MRCAAAVLALCAAFPGAPLWGGPPGAGVAHADAPPPAIDHVFVIVLENESAKTTFGPGAPAPYLARTLVGEGAYLPDYHAIGHESLDNYIAMISGQAPNIETQADCLLYTDVVPGTLGSGGQANGLGCVYPAAVPTIASELQGAGLSWRDYNQSMGADPGREAAQCGHPALGHLDNTQSATASDQYATRHDPFVYFHGIIDDAALCDSHVVALDQLPGDLASAARTPNYVFITPDLCSDGHDSSCADHARPGGFAGINQFLQTWVPMITDSPAFQQNGLLIVTFDEAATTDASSCCGEVPGPGSPLPGLLGGGGGDTGAVLLSPYIAPGTVSTVAYDHFSMLRSIEDIFGLSPLGEASRANAFGADVYTRPQGPPPPTAPRPQPSQCHARPLPAGAHGHLGSSTLITAVRVVRASHGRSAIELRAVHGASLHVTVRPRRGRTRRLRPRRLLACHSYRIALPAGSGRVRLAAVVTQGAETVARGY